MKRISLVLCMVLAWSAAASADSLKVTEIAFGTGIENHAVTGVDTSFSMDAGRLYCWCVVRNAGEGDTLFHVWTLNGTEVQRVALPVKGGRYRTNSFKTLFEGMAGNWEVEAIDRAGNVLATDSVTVRGAAPATE